LFAICGRADIGRVPDPNTRVYEACIGTVHCLIAALGM